MQAFSPFVRSRLTLARQRRGLRKNDLAARTNIDRRTLTGYESGEYPPSPEQMKEIARELRFRLSFFSREPIEQISEDNASFRALSCMKASERDMVFATGAIAIEVNKFIEQRVRLPECNIPDLRWDDPIAAAGALREHWKLGAKPIKNIIHLLEFHGIRVFSLGDECSDVDAFSLWRDGTPFVFVNRSKSGERGRFDAAHELAHLTLHRHGVTKGREAERDADRFASAFLMPEGSIRPNVPRAPRVPHLLKAKSEWKVSAAALARRCNDLGILTDWQYQSVCIELSRLGYRKEAEPNGVEQEASQALPKALAILRQDGISASDIAEALGLFPDDLSSLMFGSVLVSVDGGTAMPSSPQTPKTKLRLV